MLEPDWLIGQYKREAGIVNEAGILRLACRAEVEQKDSKCSNTSAVVFCSAFSLVVGEHEIFTFELRYSHRKAD